MHEYLENETVLGEGIHSFTDIGFLDIMKDINESVENGSISWMHLDGNAEAPEVIQFFADDEDPSIYHKIYDAFIVYQKQYLKEYSTKNYDIDYSNCEKSYILKYSEGMHGEHHFDDLVDGKTRRVTVVYYPNDDYSGGEIEFPRFNVKLKPIKDQALVFPANFVHEHIIYPTEKGTRYLIGGFFY
jgi:hypothetical protein